MLRKGGCAWWVVLVVAFLTFLVGFLWGTAASSRTAGSPVVVVDVPAPVVVTSPKAETVKTEPVASPKVEPAPRPAKTDPTPQPVKVPDPPKVEIKDPATAMPGDIVGTVNPDLKNWPTSQTPKVNDPVLLFPAQIWEGARRRFTPGGDPSREVLFLVDPGTQIVLPFDVRIEEVGGSNAAIPSLGPGGEKKRILPGLVILTPVPRPEKTDPRRTGAILLYFSGPVSVEPRIIRAGQPIVTIPESEWVFLDTAFDEGVVRLKKFNVSVVASVSYFSIYKEAETVSGTVDFFRWFTNWLTGAK